MVGTNVQKHTGGGISTICRRRMYAVTCVDRPTPYRTVLLMVNPNHNECCSQSTSSVDSIGLLDCHRSPTPYTSKLSELVEESATEDVPKVLVHRQFTVNSDAEVTKCV